MSELSDKTNELLDMASKNSGSKRPWWLQRAGLYGWCRFNGHLKTAWVLAPSRHARESTRIMLRIERDLKRRS